VRKSSIAVNSGLLRRRHDRADPLSADDALDVALVVEAEDVDRQAIVHAEGERCGVHDPETALQCLAVGQLGQESGVGLLVGITVVNAVDSVLAHQDRLRADLEGPKRGRRVGREERVARTAGENDHPPLLEMANGPAPDVGLGDFADGDGGEDPGVDSELLQAVLEGEAIEHGGEHPRVVRGGPIHSLGGRLHPPVDVSRAQHERGLHPHALNGLDLPREGFHACQVDPVLLPAEQGLTRELEQDALEGRRPAGDRRRDVALDFGAHWVKA